jgi:excisionase family DNA binding protein
MVDREAETAQVRDEHESARELSVTEAAQHLGVSRRIIETWIVSGHLPSTLVARQRRLRLDDLLAAQQRAHLGGVLPAWRADPMHAGTRLRTFREAAGMSQQRLADRCGLTHENISRLEQGAYAPYPEHIRALAAALRVPPERFVDHRPIGIRMLTLVEAAAWLDVPVDRVRRWVNQGDLEGVRASWRWLVPFTSLVELERSGRMRGQSRRLDPRYRG